MVTPFEGLSPASGREHAAWVVDTLREWGTAAHVVPDSFPAFARIHHQLLDGRRWADVAPDLVGRGPERYAYPYATDVMDVEGSLPAGQVDALVPLLAANTGSADCHYGLWDGWGWEHRTSMAWSSSSADDESRRVQEESERAMAPVFDFVSRCPLQEWWNGNRAVLLFGGPIGDVASIGWQFVGHTDIQRQSPQWWWPADRAWFVATEIDQAWTYVAGPESLIARILASDQFEATQIAPADPW